VCGYGGDAAPFFVDGELVMNICGRKNANFKDLTIMDPEIWTVC